MATENEIPYRPNDQIDFSSLKKVTNRKINEDNIRYIYNRLSDSYLSKDQISTILAAIISESGGDPLIKGSGTSKGLLQWYDDRYKISSDNPKTELDNQISFILNSLTNIKDNKSWTHGGKGSGYNKSTDAFNEFFNKESDLEHLNKSLNLAFVRPKGKHNSVQNRLDIARKIGSIIGIGNDFNEIAVSALKKVNNNPTNFIKRLEDDNRKTIKDWENPTKVATHKMSWAQDNQSALVYPNVQEVDNRLIDYTKIPYREEAAIDSAYDNKDFIRMSEEEAKWFTENYKNYFPTFNEYKNGGKMSIHIKPENRGKFNATKKRTGKTTEELTHSKNPLTRKRAIFAQNAKKWKHANGGELLGLDYYTNQLYDGGGLLNSPMVSRSIINPNLTAQSPEPVMTLTQQAVNPIIPKQGIGLGSIDPVSTVSNISTLFSSPKITSQGENQQADVDEENNFDPTYIDVSKVKKDFDTKQAMIGSIGAGAGLGSAFGPVGSAIGAVGGAVVGGIKSIFGNKKAKRKERRAKNKARGLNTMATLESYMGKAYGFADGGNINNLMGRKYFAEGGLTSFNTGGSHEESPIGGIPQGIGDNGNVNLVEEGETRYQDYIFSDRLTLDEDIVKELNLPSNLIGKTFAEASEILAKDIEEHPNDPISKRGFEEMMIRLQAANNMKKDLEDSNTFAEGGNLNGEPMEPSPSIKEVEGEDENLGNELKEVTDEQVKRIAASNIKEEKIKGGRASEEVRENATELFDPLEISVGIKVEMEHTDSIEAAREIALDHLTENKDYYTRLYHIGLIDEPITEEEENFLKEKWTRIEDVEALDEEQGIVDIPEEENVSNELEQPLNQEIPIEPQQFALGGNLDGNYSKSNPFGTALYRKGWAHPFRRKQESLELPHIPVDYTSVDWSPNFNVNLGKRQFTPRDLYDPELDTPVTSNPSIPQKLITNPSNTINPTKISDLNSVKRKQEFDPYQLEADLEGNAIAHENEASFDPTSDFELTPEQLATLSPEDYQAYKRHERAMKLQGLGSLLQYAPVLGNLIGAATVGKAEKVNPTYITPEQLNDYLQYNPIDPNTYTNPILNQASNARRSFADASGGSRAAILAANLGLNAQTQKAISDAALQAEAVNEQRRVQAKEFNRGTNQFNASERARAKQYNASSKTMTDDINARNRAARRTAIRNYLSGAMQGLGSIGREKAYRNTIKTMGMDYYLDALGQVKYKKS